MVDVDDASRKLVDELIGKNLHVTCENDEVDVVLVKQFDDLLLLFALVIFPDRETVERDAELVRNVLQIGMVADDQRDFAGRDLPRPARASADRRGSAKSWKPIAMRWGSSE